MNSLKFQFTVDYHKYLKCCTLKNETLNCKHVTNTSIPINHDEIEQNSVTGAYTGLCSTCVFNKQEGRLPPRH